MDTTKKRDRRYCITLGCLNSDKSVPHLSYFTLPKELDRRKQWLTAVGREDLLTRKDLKFRNFSVCSIHFEDSVIIEKTSRNLKTNSVPTKFLPDLSQNEREVQEDDSDKGDDTTEQDVHTHPKTCTNRKRCTTDTESGGNSAKNMRIDIDDIKINYDDIDMFGEQIAFILKRIPGKLCRELQDSIVTLVKTETKKYDVEMKVNFTASTSTVSSMTKKAKTQKSRIARKSIRNMKKEKNAIPEDADLTVIKNTQVIQHIDTQLGTQPDQRCISTIKPYHQPMTVPIELVGSLDCVKQETLDPGESRDVTGQENITVFYPIETDIKIEIEETDLIEQARRKSNSADSNM